MLHPHASTFQTNTTDSFGIIWGMRIHFNNSVDSNRGSFLLTKFIIRTIPSQDQSPRDERAAVGQQDTITAPVGQFVELAPISARDFLQFGCHLVLVRARETELVEFHHPIRVDSRR